MSTPSTSTTRTIVSVASRDLNEFAINDLHLHASLIGDKSLDTTCTLVTAAHGTLRKARSTTEPDYEDTAEDIIKIHAAIAAVGAENVVINHRNQLAIPLNDPDNPVSINDLVNQPDVAVFHIGGVSQARTGIIFPKDTAATYGTDELVTRHMRRRNATVTINDDNEHEARELIEDLMYAQLAPRPDKPYLLKVLDDKYPLLEVTIDSHGNLCTVNNPGFDEVAYSDDYDDMPSFSQWLFAAMSHRSSVTVLIQEKIDMRHEYRCFTKNGAVVTSAANIDSYTPLNIDHNTAPGSADQRIQGVRDSAAGYLDITREIRDRVLTMRGFAHMVASQLYLSSINGHSELDTYLCLDVAWDETENQPVVVEINPVAMSGLFANDVLRTGYLTDFIKHYVSNPDNKLRSFLSPDRLRGFTPVLSSDQL